jgi:hypothetical protein
VRVRNPPIPPVSIHGGGPGEYFFRKKNARGVKRDPAPKKLFGDPCHFDRLLRLSPSAHPHLHCVLSYKGEPVPPSRENKDRILEMYLHVLRGGIAAEHVYVIGVDHGDHDHSAMFRHLVAPDWPRFQPYYHDKDWLLVSDFQWLVNLRYGFNAPENPKNAQLVSIAGRKFDDEQIQFLAELRQEIANQRTLGNLDDHATFLECLKQMRCKAELKAVPDQEHDPDEDVEDSTHTHRFWMAVTTPEEIHVSIKGPVCHPSFSLKSYEPAQEQKDKGYQAFLRDPSNMWARFLEGTRKRREFNLKKHPRHCEPTSTSPSLGLEDLEPVSGEMKMD